MPCTVPKPLSKDIPQKQLVQVKMAQVHLSRSLTFVLNVYLHSPCPQGEVLGQLCLNCFNHKFCT